MSENGQILPQCPECKKRGVVSQLKTYHVSLDETVSLCPSAQCCYFHDGYFGNECLAKDFQDVLGLSVHESIEDFFLDSFSQTLDDSFPSLVTTDSTTIPECEISSPEARNLASPTLDRFDHHKFIEDIWSYHKKDYLFVLLWGNLDALCWLDVLLCHLCYNHALRSTIQRLEYTSLLKKLIVTFDECQAMIAPLQLNQNKLLESVLEMDSKPVKRGGGFSATSPLAFESSLSCSAVFTTQVINSARRKLHLAGIKMECAREEVWLDIEPKLKCQRGKDDSPVFALPLILNSEPCLADLFRVDYVWRFHCTVCSTSETISKSSVIPTVARAPHTFDPVNGIKYKLTCSSCNAGDQWRVMTVTRFADCLAMHFAEGLLSSDLALLDFRTADNTLYRVSAVIEYKVSPNHFVTWQKESLHNNKSKWMMYDDLCSKYGQFSTDTFSAPSHNIHIVFWERQILRKPSATNSQRVLSKGSNTMDSSTRIPNAVISTKSPAISSVQRVCSTKTLAGVKPSSNAVAPTSASFSSVEPSLVVLDESNDSSLSPITDCDDVSRNVPEVKKPISLLTKKLGVSNKKKTLPQMTTTYQDVLLSAQLESHALTAVTATSLASSVTNQQSLARQTSVTSSASASGKSYLDLVKPLLDKNKIKKGTGLAGYVPRAKRDALPKDINADEDSLKRKRVMFTDDTRSRPGSPDVSQVLSAIGRKRKGKQPHAATNSVIESISQKDQKQANKSLKTSIDNRRVMSITEHAVQVHRPVLSEHIDESNMPSLDDMLAEIGC